jgi:plastocyanin
VRPTRKVSLFTVAAALAFATLGIAPALAARSVQLAQAFTVHLDAQPHGGEPWDFLRFFPNAIQVHSGDVVRAAWAGTGAPHTASLVNSDDPEAWRAENQGPGGAYELSVPDSQLGGDDQENDLNPAVSVPAPGGCGDKANPCTFDGSSVVNSGQQFSAPGAQPSFVAKITAPVGTYSLLCMLHPGMEMPVAVVPAGQHIPAPNDVKDLANAEIDQANRVDGVQADAQAQSVTVTSHHGHSLWTINAGGFSNQVTANEFVGAGLTVHVGDQMQVLGNFEIHTATLPSSSFDTTPFIKTQCEVPGPDIPAQSPADCQDPSQFQAAFNNTAVLPSASNKLRDTTEFVNSGLLVPGVNATFVAKAPGFYTMICLVHGPVMSTAIVVEP